MLFLLFISFVQSSEPNDCKIETWVFDRDVACSKGNYFNIHNKGKHSEMEILSKCQIRPNSARKTGFYINIRKYWQK